MTAYKQTFTVQINTMCSRCLHNLNKTSLFLLIKFILLCASLYAVSFNSAAAVWSITYPKSPLENDKRTAYPLALLELAIQKTGVRYELNPSVLPMRQAKAIKRLEENLEINVFWSMTDIEREEDLRPIRIPIVKGLIGWRVLLSHNNNTFREAEINTFDDLLAFSPVQGLSWPDTKILQANGFNVVTSRDYVEATSILNNQLADFFPRAVTEVTEELSNRYSKNFVIKKGVVIHYPTALYFFTNKRNVTLARLIETGLNRAIEDGSFDELFQQYFGETLANLDIENSLQFELTNPLLPLETPLYNKKYWYNPSAN